MSSSVKVGDRVQIRAGGMDVTNGVTAKAGSMYGEGGPLWATVTDITEEWVTGGKFGLPQKVTKVRCSNSGIVVWQVQPEDIATNVHKSDEEPVTTTPPDPPDPPAPTKSGEEALKSAAVKALEMATAMLQLAQKSGATSGGGNSTYAPVSKSADWTKGGQSSQKTESTTPKTQWPTTAMISDSMFASNADQATPTYPEVSVTKGKNATMPHDMKRYRVYGAKYKTSWQSSGRKKEMLNDDQSLIQNQYQYPYKVRGASGQKSAVYDYAFIPGDPRYSNGPASSIEDKLAQVRAQYGLQVHGNPDIERNVMYYMYNRFKTPDLGMAHNKTFTHVFFTRPDLYLMEDATHVANQVSLNSEMTMIWRRHPDLVRLLCDGNRIKDGNNFNLLLSNRIRSFPMTAEGLSKLEVGKSWNDHKVVYGDGYTGRFAGEFSCTFDETNDYSVSTLMKLWITYIDNVSRGAMTPYYGPHEENSFPLTIAPNTHVHDKALDYAASAYVFKVGPDGEDILYWTKYYGVFPLTTGSSAFGWDAGQDFATPRLDISFGYSWKLDLNPISLFEFNAAAGIKGGVQWAQAFNKDLPGSGRPLVGAPYIEFVDREPTMKDGPRPFNAPDKKPDIEGLRLKFQRDTKAYRGDKILFRPN